MMIAAASYASTSVPAAGALARSGTAGTSAAAATDAAPGSVPRVVFNPRSHFDSEAGVFVMEFRSTRTGEIERRFPDEQQLKVYRQAAARKRGDAQAAVIV